MDPGELPRTVVLRNPMYGCSWESNDLDMDFPLCGLRRHLRGFRTKISNLRAGSGTPLVSALLPYTAGALSNSVASSGSSASRGSVPGYRWHADSSGEPEAQWPHPVAYLLSFVGGVIGQGSTSNVTSSRIARTSSLAPRAATLVSAPRSQFWIAPKGHVISCFTWNVKT